MKPDYQVVKQDQEELEAVCKVMEDLIRMHTSIFTVRNSYYTNFTEKKLHNFLVKFGLKFGRKTRICSLMA